MDKCTSTSNVVPEEASFETAPSGVCLISTDFRFLQINQTMAASNGLAVEDHLGKPVADVAPELGATLKHMMEQSVETGMPVGPVEYSSGRTAEAGTARHWIATLSPVLDEHGKIFAASVAALDITERKMLERQKEQAFHNLQRQLAQQMALADLSQEAIGDISLDEVMRKAVHCAAEMLEVPLAKILIFTDTADQLKLVAGTGWHDGLVGHASVGIEAESQAGFTLMSHHPVIVTDLRQEDRFSGPALLHEHGVRSGVSVVITGTNSRPLGVFGIHTTEVRQFEQNDVHFLISLAAVVTNAARKESASAQRTLLVREMAHRAGNMLQLVSSIAAQTFRNTTDLEGARKAFNDRLGSLARANHVIAKEGWQDTRFQQVVTETLHAFDGQVELAGRDILLPPDLSFDLGLVLHELSTNSCKYGALGVDGGRVRVIWRIASAVDRPVFQMDWIDEIIRKGQSSEAGRLSSGFGSRLINLLVNRKWQGSVTVDQSNGYRCEICVPLGPDRSSIDTLG